jgi:hypothetical protein
VLDVLDAGFEERGGGALGWLKGIMAIVVCGLLGLGALL